MEVEGWSLSCIYNLHTMYNTHASLSVEKLLATARSGTHIRTSLSVEKLLATARSGTKIYIYIIYIIHLFASKPDCGKTCSTQMLYIHKTSCHCHNICKYTSGHHTPQMGNINLTHTSGHSLVTMSMCAHTHTHTPHRIPVRLLTNNLHSQ